MPHASGKENAACQTSDLTPDPCPRVARGAQSPRLLTLQKLLKTTASFLPCCPPSGLRPSGKGSCLPAHQHRGTAHVLLNLASRPCRAEETVPCLLPTPRLNAPGHGQPEERQRAAWPGETEARLVETRGHRRYKEKSGLGDGMSGASTHREARSQVHEKPGRDRGQSLPGDEGGRQVAEC